MSSSFVVLRMGLRLAGRLRATRATAFSLLADRALSG